MREHIRSVRDDQLRALPDRARSGDLVGVRAAAPPRPSASRPAARWPGAPAAPAASAALRVRRA